MHRELSLAIITLNEEDNIERCIRSVPFATEVLVVDSHSTDKTCEIAEGLGARVIRQEWLGFEKQKQMALDSCKNRWVLSLDADEALSLELADEIKELLQTESITQFNCYRMPRLSYHFKKWIRHGGWYPDHQIRLIDRENARWSGGELHEHIEADRVGTLKNNLHHYVFKNLSHQVITNDRYSSLGAEDLRERGKKFSLLKLLVRPVGKFIECYILKRGFLDGIPGFIIAVGAGYSMFLRYAKLYESSRKRTI